MHFFPGEESKTFRIMTQKARVMPLYAYDSYFEALDEKGRIRPSLGQFKLHPEDVQTYTPANPTRTIRTSSPPYPVGRFILYVRLTGSTFTALSDEFFGLSDSDKKTCLNAMHAYDRAEVKSRIVAQLAGLNRAAGNEPGQAPGQADIQEILRPSLGRAFVDTCV